MAMTTVLLPERVFDRSGNTRVVDRPVRVLDGVLLNGSLIDAQDLAELGLS